MSNIPMPPLASPPCYAEELDHGVQGAVPRDAQQARDVARWRRAERERLTTERKGLSVATRAHVSFLLSERLRALISDLTDGVQGRVIAGYWPIRGELDLRPLLREWRAAGAQLALPVVETRAAPLVFRQWTQGATLQRGEWSIPVPPASAAQVTPDIVLSPLVGWDAGGYRLGNGGGYYDRTLAAISAPPLTIGVGLQAARLPTIFPQAHDIAMTWIVTEQGVQSTREPLK